MAEFSRAGLLAVIIAALAFLGACSDSENTTTNQRHELTQPEVRRSSGGELNTTLRMAITANDILGPDTASTSSPPNSVVLQSVRTPNYEGVLTGPTLVVKPGDTLIMNLVNDFPENPEEERKSTVAGQAPAPFPHDPYTTNMHTHGLLVTPIGVGDNIYREMPPFPETLDNNYHFEVEIPFDHPIGTFWYHPHKHGSASYQFYGGMAGFLIIEGGEGTLDLQPEVHAAEDVLIAIQAIRVLQENAPPAGNAMPGETPFINEEAIRFSTRAPEGLVEEELPPEDNEEENIEAALWGPYANTNFWLTANGKVNPTLTMYEGQVQRWRMVNALAGHTLALQLEQHDLNVVAHDGLTMPEMRTLPPTDAYVLDAGSRADIMIKAGAPGTYRLLALDVGVLQLDNFFSVTIQGIDPDLRPSQVASVIPSIANGQSGYPLTVMTVVVRAAAAGEAEMALPSGPLPVDQHLRDLEALLIGEGAVVDATRNVSFELCGQNQGALINPLDTCAAFRTRYEAMYWGGIDFSNFAMMRDFDDTALVKDGLFNGFVNLFDDMFEGNVEEWTIHNRSFSDHPFHIHQNPFLVTQVNGTPLPVPEWHDTILVPAAVPAPPPDNTNINMAMPGTITFRTYLDPRTRGRFVAHCHILTHEDVGMMQALEIRERPASTTAQN